MADRVSAEKVYEYVREKIVSKELFPGNRIVEEDLADELHTSRTTIRNGIVTLKNSGLVDVVPNYGTFVTKPNYSEMLQIYSLRVVLESEAIRQAVPRISNAGLKRMEANLEAQRRLTKNYSMAKYVDLNTAFHEEILLASENNYLVKYLRELFNKTAVFLTFYDTSVSNEESLISHEQMFEALVKRDEKASLEALKSDLTIAVDCISIK